MNLIRWLIIILQVSSYREQVIVSWVWLTVIQKECVLGLNPMDKETNWRLKL